MPSMGSMDPYRWITRTQAAREAVNRGKGRGITKPAVKRRKR